MKRSSEGNVAATRRRKAGSDSAGQTGRNVRRVRGTGAAEVYQRVREDILSLRLKPGAALDEATLSTRFGLSRSPVREALIRLSAEGLVAMLPNRSTLVAPFDVQMLPRYLDALDLLQRATNRLAALLRDEQDLVRMRAALQRVETATANWDPLDMIEANRDFHLVIAEAGKNPYLTMPYARLLDEGQRMLRVYFDFLDHRLPDELMDEHAKMVDAITARDAERAECLAHSHASQFRGRFMEYLSQTFTSQVSVIGSNG